ncbi:MAG: SDR family NAD(P)-dependent oxidoreductase [Acidimicrobiia bacterium]
MTDNAAKPNEWTVVAGATGAIGRGIVDRMLRRGLGVVAVARTSSSLDLLANGHSAVVVCEADITSDESIGQIQAVLPRVCRAVINAAAAPMGGHVDDVSPEAVLAAMDVKVNGTLRLVRATEPGFVQDSRVIALGGNLGYDPIPDAATAGVGNAALANLIRQLSRSLGSRGVTCHVVAPGPVWTDRLQVLIGDAARARGVPRDDVVAEFEARSPIHRLVTVDEVSWAVDMLLAPEARALTGGTLLVDAGQRTAIP